MKRERFSEERTAEIGKSLKRPAKLNDGIIASMFRSSIRAGTNPFFGLKECCRDTLSIDLPEGISYSRFSI